MLENCTFTFHILTGSRKELAVNSLLSFLVLVMRLVPLQCIHLFLFYIYLKREFKITPLLVVVLLESLLFGALKYGLLVCPGLMVGCSLSFLPPVVCVFCGPCPTCSLPSSFCLEVFPYHSKPLSLISLGGPLHSATESV